jgi:hypothetical protein
MYTGSFCGGIAVKWKLYVSFKGLSRMNVFVWTVLLRVAFSIVWLLNGYSCDGDVFVLKNSSAVLK